MPSTVHPARANRPVVLLVEEEVLIRLSIAEYLRGCGFWVIEAASAGEAKAILLADEPVDILFSDAQLAGDASGFALGQWVRRRRPNIALILTATIAGKARAAAELCDHHNIKPKPCEHATLTDRIQLMLARRGRKTKGPRATWRALSRVRRV